jgi:hypothetical protein
VRHLTLEELEAGLPEILLAPKDNGELKMIVRRPNNGAREVLTEGQLHFKEGLVGDNWKSRSNRRAGSNLYAQLTVMNSRVIELLAGSRDRWPLAGDQLFLDFDLNRGNLAPGTHVAIGDAVIEVMAQPHTGCGKFSSRFGVDANKFVNSKSGRELSLRGINARVVQEGRIRVGNLAHKLH